MVENEQKETTSKNKWNFIFGFTWNGRISSAPQLVLVYTKNKLLPFSHHTSDIFFYLLIKNNPDDTPVPRANNKTGDRFGQYSIGLQYQSSMGSEIHESELVDYNCNMIEGKSYAIMLCLTTWLKSVALDRNLFSIQNI